MDQQQRFDNRTLFDKRIFSDPSCEVCAGAGVHFSEAQGGYIHCECHERVRVIRMTGRSQIPARYVGSSLMQMTASTPMQRKTLNAATAWPRDYRPGKDGIFFMGPVGTGKTHMLCALCILLIKYERVQPLYFTAAEFFREIKAEWNTKGETDTPSTFDMACESTVLVLDDVGSEMATDWSTSEFAELVDYRTSNGKTLLMASNLDFAGFAARYGKRTADRIQERCEVLTVDGESHRKRRVA